MTARGTRRVTVGIAVLLLTLGLPATAPSYADGRGPRAEDPVISTLKKQWAPGQATARQHRASIPRGADWRSSAPRTAVSRASSAALDPQTDTLYLAGGGDAGTVYVIDSRTCNAQRRACRPPVATTSSGRQPVGIVVDPSTHTVYVSYADDGVVAVIDGAACNARVTSGCSRTPGVIPVEGALGLVIGDATKTLYVGSFADRVSLIDLRTCNARNRSGCTTPVATIAADGPGFPTLDADTDTLYLPENGPGTNGEGATLALVDLRTCSAPSARDCGVVARSPMATGPVAAVVDPSTDTLYATGQYGRGVSVIDRSRCNAHNTTRCAAGPVATIDADLDPGGVALDPTTHTVYVLSQFADTMAAIDTRRCSARRPAGCGDPLRSRATGGDPTSVLVDARTHTVYVTEWIDGFLVAYDGRRCNATNVVGCRREAPAAPATGYGDALDPLQRTAYYALSDSRQIGLRDTSVCNAGRLLGCGAPLILADVDKAYAEMSVRQSSHTLYARDPEAGRVDVIDTDSCNARQPRGCAAVASFPGADVIGIWPNPRTGTVYVTRANGDVSVFRHCDTLSSAGCSRALYTTHVAEGMSELWFDAATKTIYVATSADSVAVLPQEACERGTSGCRVLAATPVGSGPTAVAGDPSTHTVYVTNNGFDDRPGIVSIIDTRRCSAARPAGCATTWPTIATPRTPFGAVVDAATRKLFVTNFGASRMSVIDIVRCNAMDRRGCASSVRQIATGQLPAVTRIDPLHRTAYVLNSFDQTVSVISTQHPCRTGLCF